MNGRKSFGAKKGGRGAAGDINYKDTKLLLPFVPERAKILPRRISGTCALHQRKLRVALMRARQLALIPYTAE
jgi:small subunit ribosomal protein S18